MTTTEATSHYRFGHLEQRGVLLGWRGGQVLVVLGGAVGAVILLHLIPGLMGALPALAVLIVALTTAWLPLGGRTVEQWAPAVARWSVRACRQRFFSPPELPLPRIVTLPGLEAGVLHDPRARTLTAVLALKPGDFALSDAISKLQRVTRWSAVLASLARSGSAVRRIQWAAVSTAEDGRAWWADFGRRASMAASTPPRRSYAELLSTVTASAMRHRVLLAISVRAPGGARTRRSEASGVAAGGSTLLREVRTIAGALGEADVPVVGLLDERGLVRAMREIWSAQPEASGVPWPSSVTTRWSRVHTEDLWHAVYWVAEWPRVDVGPEFLAPLLIGSARRTMSMVMEPLDPARAIRLVQRARMADMADAELRRRGGFLKTARRNREAEMVTRREAELTDGHAAYRFSGYLVVSATSPEKLDVECEVSEQAASLCGLELRRLYGEQDAGLVGALPLGAGLR